MKRQLSVILALFLTLGLTACDGTGGISGSDVGGELPINHNNPRVDYTPEELAGILNKFPNIRAAEDILSDAPKSLGHVSTFEDCSAAALSFEEGLANFREALGYLAPGHELGEKYFKATGGGESDGLSIYDHYDEFKSGDRTVNLFEYNESNSGIKDPIYFYARTPVCSDLSSFNRGTAQRLTQPDSSAVSFVFQGASIEGAEYVGKFAPDSGERFKLLDKEVSVKEAVGFFEDYVSAIPCRAGFSYTTGVNYVNVYKIKDDLYCFDYIASRNYDNIAFDFTVTGHSDRRGGDMSMGSMIESDSVDSFYGVIRAFTVENEKQYAEFISLENAAKIVSDNMTDQVKFEARSVRLLYCPGDNIGSSGAPGERRTAVFPMWVFELYNPNDALTYNFYVNALDGTFEYYH